MNIHIPVQTEKGKATLPMQERAWRLYRQLFLLANGSRDVRRIASLLHWHVSDVERLSHELMMLGYLEMKVEERMDSIDIDNCRASWGMVGGDVAKFLFLQRMYKRILLKHPDLVSLFSKTDMEHQIRSLLATINIALATAERLDSLTQTLQNLGRRHVEKGVKPEYYPLVVEAMIETFQEVLGTRFTEKMKESWENLLQAIATKMLSH